MVVGVAPVAICRIHKEGTVATMDCANAGSPVMCYGDQELCLKRRTSRIKFFVFFVEHLSFVLILL